MAKTPFPLNREMIIRIFAGLGILVFVGVGSAALGYFFVRTSAQVEQSSLNDRLGRMDLMASQTADAVRRLDERLKTLESPSQPGSQPSTFYDSADAKDILHRLIHDEVLKENVKDNGGSVTIQTKRDLASFDIAKEIWTKYPDHTIEWGQYDNGSPYDQNWILRLSRSGNMYGSIPDTGIDISFTSISEMGSGTCSSTDPGINAFAGLLVSRLGYNQTDFAEVCKAVTKSVSLPSVYRSASGEPIQLYIYRPTSVGVYDPTPPLTIGGWSESSKQIIFFVDLRAHLSGVRGDDAGGIVKKSLDATRLDIERVVQRLLKTAKNARCLNDYSGCY